MTAEKETANPQQPTVLAEPDGAAAAIREYCRSNDLRKDEYVREGQNPLRASCYPVAEAYYHVRDCQPEVYCLSWSDVDPSAEGTHWYLREADGGAWIDLTLPEGAETLPPYGEGTRRGFLTGDEPSNRAEEILEAIA